MHQSSYVLQVGALFNKSVEKIRNLEKWHLVRPAFTVDLWKSRAHKEFLGITCHWISIRPGDLSDHTPGVGLAPVWELKARNLGCCPVPDICVDHTGKSFMCCSAGAGTGGTAGAGGGGAAAAVAAAAAAAA